MFYRIALVLLLFMGGCSFSPKLNNKSDTSYITIESNISLNRKIFNKFLEDVKPLISPQKLPKVFISYAWETRRTKEGTEANKKLQSFLVTLQEDLEYIGIETFLDIKFLQGDVRENIKYNLEHSDFVILIGTPRLNERAIRDRLFVMPYFDISLIPKKGNVVALVESTDFYAVYYLEEGNLKEIITLNLDLKDIPWIDRTSGRNGIKEAYISHTTNLMLEDLFKRLKSRKYKTVSNIQFELGITIDKVHKNPKTLIPLLLNGDYNSSFPTIIQNNLIRNIKTENEYYMQMSALTNPLGIIAALSPTLIRDYRYLNLVNNLEMEMRFKKRKVHEISNSSS